MPMTPGLVPNLRQPPPDDDTQVYGGGDVIVEMAEEQPEIEMDEAGNILRIDHGDGSVTVSLDGKPIETAGERKDTESWFRNLVDDIDGGELTRIAEELMRGVDDDITSRNDWVEDRAQGLKLLGLKMETPGVQGGADGAPVEGMSRVRHPLLLEAVLRFQANARSELLPTDGPVKVRNDANASTVDQDRMADYLENDLNHYLTKVASEYYPDTDRMLLMLGFGGTAFKKVYFCPLRNRPVSESIDAENLIVNNAATDLRNAKRITHRVMMRPSTVKRLQILGVYQDLDLGVPVEVTPDAAQAEKKAIEGVSNGGRNPLDRDREIYECYCELDIQGFEHKQRGKITGLEIPYRVTIDVSSRQILSIVRNYDEDTKELPEARQTFVKYTFVPGVGFYDIGLLHILGNTTNAVTAAWRELLDSGMYANFPGFLFADAGGRQNTNIFRIPPGGGAMVKTNGMPINQAIMPLPYNAQAAPSLMALVENMVQTGMRVGGTAELAVGEGRADAPVGTTLALIDQATKVLNSVHKRMHAAQAEEFQLLVSCFRENPESFWERNRRPSTNWSADMLIAALNDCELVPQADPNTASQTQRVMKVMALKQLQQGSPSLYDPIAVDTEALRTIGWSNPEQFMVPPEAAANPPPELQQAMSKIENDRMRAEADMIRAQADVQAKAGQLQSQMFRDQLDAQKLQSEIGVTQGTLSEKQKDRLSKERIQLIDLAQNLAVHPESAPLVAPLAEPILRDMGMVPGQKPQGGQ